MARRWPPLARRRARGRVIATVHPSSILRADEENREAEMAAFVSDLKTVAAHV